MRSAGVECRANAEFSHDDAQREAVALAVDRAALYNVIFQKQGEMTASLLPNALTGYSFLFPKERDLARAQALRGGANGAPLTLTVERAQRCGAAGG